jgi:predicted protein tyrosine phosphatase
MSLQLTICDLITAMTTVHRYDAVVSLVNPGIERRGFPHPPSGPWLFIQVRDAEDEKEGAPTITEARALLEFYESISARIDRSRFRLLLHCHAGISRSPAAAMILLARHLGPGRELEAAAEVFRVRPAACPNLALLRAGDELLNRQGALVAAAKEAAAEDTLGSWLSFRPASLEPEE